MADKEPRTPTAETRGELQDLLARTVDAGTWTTDRVARAEEIRQDVVRQAAAADRDEHRAIYDALKTE